MNPPPRMVPELEPLAELFYPSLTELGHFEAVDRADVPPVYRALLHHEHHMTVTVENFHGCPVDVEVLQVEKAGHHYARKILLHRQTDHDTVQFGIVRMNFNLIDDAICRDIESQKIPLGRILIQHNVLRVIHLVQLWKITPAQALQELLEMGPKEITYGRTAVIDCNGEPAVELLEIVTPVRD